MYLQVGWIGKTRTIVIKNCFIPMRLSMECKYQQNYRQAYPLKEFQIVGKKLYGFATDYFR
jgi:hypothetical protein